MPPPPPLHAHDLLLRLATADVQFVIVGGVAATLHGLDYTTNDLDICAELRGENLVRLISAIRDLNPRQRMHPNRPPFPPDIETTPLNNFYAETDLGMLDVLNNITGVGDYAAVLERSRPIELDGAEYNLIDLETLIAAKRAAGRVKDRLSLPGLEFLLKMKKGEHNQSDESE